MDYIYETRMEVRDYECDIEGIVNNANYLHYTEHTRHRFLHACGISFADMHRKGVDVVVARMSLRYRRPLRCDDKFISKLALQKDGLRYVFYHDIYRDGDNELCFKCKAELVCLINGKMGDSEDYDNAFRQYIERHKSGNEQ